jgi:hypothetical protein
MTNKIFDKASDAALLELAEELDILKDHIQSRETWCRSFKDGLVKANIHRDSAEILAALVEELRVEVKYRSLSVDEKSEFFHSTPPLTE